MEDFNSKYTGEQVEALLDIVAEGGSGGGGEGEVQKTTEAEITAMGFTKNLGTITEVKMNGTSKGTSGVVDLGDVQTPIADLATIREGANKGATALQSSDVDTELSSESANPVQNQAVSIAFYTLVADIHQTITLLQSYIDGKVDKVNGKQLSTEDFTSALKTKLEGLSNYNDAAIQAAVSSLQTQLNTLTGGNTSTAIESFNEIIAFLAGITDSENLDSIIASIEQQIAGKQATISDLDTIRSGASKGATAVQPSSLATVATSGSYNDLSNKPTIPAAVTESTVSGWGFTKNSGTYSKPSGGIPKSDLASAVQTSLGKADTALQSYTEKYKGTVTGVKLNGTTYNPSNGIVDLGTISSGGSEGGSSGGGVYPLVDHGTSNTTFTLTPNTYHKWGEVNTLNLSLGSETAGVVNEFCFEFFSGAIGTTLSLPNTIAWANEEIIDIDPYYIYQVSIVNNIAVFTKGKKIEFFTVYNVNDGKVYGPFAYEVGMTGEEMANSSYNGNKVANQTGGPSILIDNGGYQQFMEYNELVQSIQYQTYGGSDEPV